MAALHYDTKTGQYFSEEQARQLHPEWFASSTPTGVQSQISSNQKGGFNIGNYIPGREIGKSIVQAGSNIKNLATGGRAKYEQGLKEGNRVNVPALIGDYAQAAATVIPALPKAKALSTVVGGGGRMGGFQVIPASRAAKATAFAKNTVGNAGMGYAYDVGANMKEGDFTPGDFKPGAATAISTARPLVGATLGGIGRVAENKAIQNVASGKTSQPGAIKKFFSGRTPEQVLATPKDKLHKLSSSERDYYFSNAREGVEKQARQIADQAVQATEKGLANLERQTEELTRKLQVASRDEVLRLRPKIREALGRQSAKYRQLVGEQLNDKKDVPIDETAFVNFVRTRFADNPAHAETMLSKLGVDPNRVEGISTLGKIVDHMRLLRKGMSSSAKSGARVYSPDERLTDDAIHTLSTFLKENGVDLAEANQFWARYVPIRNQLIKEAKPFVQSDVQTKTFANTISRVLKGDDVNNEKFIQAVEDLVETKIGPNMRGILSQLDDVQKKSLAEKVALEGRKMEAKLAKEASMKKLTNEQFEANRRSGWRRIIRSLVVGSVAPALLIGGGAAVLAGGNR